MSCGGSAHIQEPLIDFLEQDLHASQSAGGGYAGAHEATPQHSYDPQLAGPEAAARDALHLQHATSQGISHRAPPPAEEHCMVHASGVRLLGEPYMSDMRQQVHPRHYIYHGERLPISDKHDKRGHSCGLPDLSRPGQAHAHLLGGALREEDVHQRLVGVQGGSLGKALGLLHRTSAGSSLSSGTVRTT